MRFFVDCTLDVKHGTAAQHCDLKNLTDFNERSERFAEPRTARLRLR